MVAYVPTERNTEIVIHLSKFRLELKRRIAPNEWHTIKKYWIAPGAVGTPTPKGSYEVHAKSATPDWADSYGVVHKYGSKGNPLYGGFISIFPERGIGIHGTTFPALVGRRASHGCIRMTKRGIRDIYDRVPIGTRVYVR